MDYRVKVLLNETPDHRFGHYGAGDTLVEGPEFTIEARELGDVPELLWSIGNKMESDITGHWYKGFRSVSVGDVILVTGGDVIGFGALFACEIAGWKRL
jgi:hypothetical protein